MPIVGREYNRVETIHTDRGVGMLTVPTGGGGIFQQARGLGLYPPAGVGNVPTGQRLSNASTCREVEVETLPNGLILWGGVVLINGVWGISNDRSWNCTYCVYGNESASGSENVPNAPRRTLISAWIVATMRLGNVPTGLVGTVTTVL